ncbi:DUF4129 domain-containing protein [Halosimplex aquaticum]|uniref:DUF4129 domain-containing protein n=1 Tax=Halosimplex aquaticum TaxID=3026162 RepID=A0ABD5Y5Q4_9EURY|nr:DUF4129 domain-containing protein [Halosimplex aquaticum]
MDDYVSQEALRFVVIGLVAMAAIAVGAATITATVDTGAPGGGEPLQNPGQNPQDNQGGGGGDSSGGGNPVNRSSENPGNSAVQYTTCIEPLSNWYGGLAYFGAAAMVVFLIKRRYSFGAAFLGLYALAPPVLLGYFLGTDCASVGGPGLGDGGRGAIANGTQSPIASMDIPPAAILGIFGIVLVATAAVLMRASGDQDITTMEPEADDEDTGADVMDLAAAAGRAADRLEEHNADVDNEVYRAWWEMTSMLDVPNPDSATPGEFAQAAIEVGLGEDDVRELTRLFEEVRYGKRDAESREQLAIDVFRNIEDEYGGRTSGGRGGDAGGDDGY